MDKHPSPAKLEKFGRGRLSRWQSREVVRHLLTGCVPCNERTSSFLPSGSLQDRGVVYGAAFEESRLAVEARRASLAAERDAAPELLRELLSGPEESQRTQAVVDSRFHNWALCDRLLEAARECGFQEPGRALEMAKLGVEVASRLDRGAYGSERVNDISARAWASLGNAERIRSDFRAAEKSFARSESLLKQGTGDPIEKAFVLLHLASLRGNQQRFREAFRLLDRVMAIGRRCDDPELCGRALVTRGFLLGMANDQEAAIRLLGEGVELLDPQADPRLLVAAHHNLTLYLAESGRYEEAMRRLERTRPLYVLLGDRMNLVRLQWIEGKIATALGDFEHAEVLLLEVRRELAERELGFDTALLSLDLARIYARQRRGSEMRRLAEEMIPIFQSRDIQREAIAALLIFQKAAEMERVTLGLVQELSEYLKECRGRLAPGFRLRESA